MRVLRLADPDDFVVDFHPYVTVVRGLDEQQHGRLVEALAALPAGREAGLGGLIEAHGVLLDLNADMLELLALSSPEVDIVVRGDDLPGRGSSAAARQLRTAQRNRDALADRVARAIEERDAKVALVEEAEEAVALIAGRIDVTHADAGQADQRHDELVAAVAAVEAARARADASVVEADGVVEAARERVATTEAATSAMREQRLAAGARGTEVAAALEAAQGGVDEGAAADLAAAEAHLAEVVAELEAEREAEATDESEPEPLESIEARLAQYEVDQERIDGLLAALASIDTTAVRVALESVADESAEPVMVPSTEAQDIAAQLRIIEDDLVRLESIEPVEGSIVAEARARLDEARAKLVDAEQAVRLPQLEPDDVNRLEAAHAEVLDAQDKTEGRFAGGRAQKRLEDARAAEDELLARLGFNSYADYMMGTSILHVDPESEARLDAARSELAEAEDAWASMQAGVDVELERASLIERRRVLREQANRVLGEAPSDDVVETLQAHLVPAVGGGDSVGELRLALQHVGLAVAHEDLEPVELVMLGREWVTEEERAASRRDELIIERDVVADQIAQLRFQLEDSARSDGSAPGPEDRREARLAEARGTVAAVEERVRRHEAALVDCERLAAEFDAAQADEADLAGQIETSEVELGEAATALEIAIAKAAEAREELARTVAEVDGAIAAREAFERDLDAASGGDLERELEQATALVTERQSLVVAAEAALATLEQELAEASDEVEALGSAVDEVQVGVDHDEVEWYLLARLAAQRQVSFAGSVPLVLDDALLELDDVTVPHVLDRLERMAAAVQLVVVSDQPAVAAWAESAGDDRVAIVRPVPSAEAAPI